MKNHGKEKAVCRRRLSSASFWRGNQVDGLPRRHAIDIHDEARLELGPTKYYFRTT